ncbi:MAG: rRNA maturation RNase YbeY [Hyphomonadaceae bacterium]|nr:rRNA maturation RNase YbeY [Hyphomonadaceae bacterium]
MSILTADIRIEADAWQGLGDLDALAARALAAGAAEAGHDSGGEIAILFTGDAAMQALNRDWRGKNMPTDVLSFPADERDAGFLGDLALGYEICARDAGALDRDLSAHLTHLLVHGLLHLLGHDHETDEEAERMEALEIKALARLGLPDPYLK